MRLRRKVWLHSGYLLATTLFLLPPILGRLSPLLPGLAINGPADFVKLGIGFQIANAVTALIALFIAKRSRVGRPFYEGAALVALSGLLYQTIGGWAPWQALYARFADVPVLPFALAAGVAGIAIGWAGWTEGSRTARPADALAA